MGFKPSSALKSVHFLCSLNCRAFQQASLSISTARGYIPVMTASGFVGQVRMAYVVATAPELVCLTFGFQHSADNRLYHCGERRKRGVYLV